MIQSSVDRSLSTQNSHELWASECNLFKWCPERVLCLLREQACSNGTACCGWRGSAPQKSSNTQPNHGILLQLHILLRFISLQLCTENTTGRSSLMFGIYGQLSPQCYIHLIRQGGLGKWEGSVWSLLSSKDVTKGHHFIPGRTLLRRYRSTVKIKSHHCRALLPCFPAVPSLCLLVFYMP